jgi:hypothetical protein
LDLIVFIWFWFGFDFGGPLRRVGEKLIFLSYSSSLTATLSNPPREQSPHTTMLQEVTAVPAVLS